MTDVGSTGRGSAPVEVPEAPAAAHARYEGEAGRAWVAPLPDSAREPWLAIAPKPLAGDPGFELLPALRNRWDDITATGDVPRAVHRRFDLMTEVLGLDRARARGWTLGWSSRLACGKRRAARRPTIRCSRRSRRRCPRSGDTWPPETCGAGAGIASLPQRGASHGAEDKSSFGV